jgi:hypothetical protein
MTITRPFEPLRGENRAITRQRLANQHIAQPIRVLLRAARPNGIMAAPPELRRGWVLCCLETIAEYRSTWKAVDTGNFGYREPVRRRDV